MIQIASFALFLALCCGAYALIAAGISITFRSHAWLASGVRAISAVAGLLTLATCLLWYFLFQRDFRLTYAASFTNLALSPVYIFSALWTGQEGSLLLWGWLLSLCSVLTLRTCRKASLNGQFNIAPYPAEFPRQLPYLVSVCAVTLGFFLFLLLIFASPFVSTTAVPSDGQGMSPLLQNIYMVLHPPILFLGYAGFFAPFALALTALCAGEQPKQWLPIIRRWTLFAWYVLGLGILLGARWAYLELGWGGYWAWDPVENASFLPWMVSTALLHTLSVQRRRGGFLRWNLMLSILVFALCIFGTFITRSGLLDSVHAFTQSPLGWYFLGFLLLIGLTATGLLAYRWRMLRTPEISLTFSSKDGSFALANQLMIGFTFAVFYGTVYPLLSGALFGKATVIGPPFFNLIAKIIGLILLGLTGFCQALSWEPRSWQETVRQKLALPLILSAVGAITLWLSGIQDLVMLLTASLGVFVLATVDLTGFRKLSDFLRWNTFIHRKRQWASYAFHAGMAIMLVGIVASATYKDEQEISLSPGASATVGRYTLRYVQLEQRADAEKAAVIAEIEIFAGERRMGFVRPERRFYDNAQETTEIGLSSSISRDIYVILLSVQDNQNATFSVMIHPFISWLWIGGGLVFAIGMLLRL